MTLLLTAAMAAATSTVPVCAWDRPGHNPFVGNVVAAVDRYTDIPPAVRARLQRRLAVRQYDEVVEIRRDSIRGQHDYAPELRDMFFGVGKLCRTITRANWPAAALERGLVYCEDGHCLVLPTVCGNLSRIQRLPSVLAAAAGKAAPDDEVTVAEAPASAAAPQEDELRFDPPAAGRSFSELAAEATTEPVGGLSPASTPADGDGAEGGQGPFSPGGAAAGPAPSWGGSGPGGGTLPGGGAPGVVVPPPPPIPEPASRALWLIGLGGLVWWRRRGSR